VIIAARFNGPPGTGNGGYSCGLVAARHPAGTVEVTLRRPPPLDTELRVEHDGDAVRIFHGTEVIAQATPAQVDDVTAGVGYGTAVDASRSYRGLISHPFPTCFVCGPQRQDGLRLFPGPVGPGRVATPFVVPDDISPVLMWAALDCPGGWTVPQEERAYVLGRLAARIDALPEPGQECVVVGELTGESGRKAYAVTTVYSVTGTVLATARATWIAVA
jgi:hypothetical protein